MQRVHVRLAATDKLELPPVGRRLTPAPDRPHTEALNGLTASGQLLALQRTIGNAATVDLLRNGFSSASPTTLQRTMTPASEKAGLNSTIAAAMKKVDLVAGDADLRGRCKSMFGTTNGGVAATRIQEIATALRGLPRDMTTSGFVHDDGLPANQAALADGHGNRARIRLGTGFPDAKDAKKATTLVHEGSHILSANATIDIVYKESGLHYNLPAEQKLRNAANFEQIAIDVLAGKPTKIPRDGGGIDEAFVKKVHGIVVAKVTRAWVAGPNQIGKDKATKKAVLGKKQKGKVATKLRALMDDLMAWTTFPLRFTTTDRMRSVKNVTECPEDWLGTERTDSAAYEIADKVLEAAITAIARKSKLLKVDMAVNYVQNIGKYDWDEAQDLFPAR